MGVRGWDILVAVIFVIAALLARLALHAYLGDRGQFPLFLLAVAAAAWYGGLWPGVVAAVGGFVIAAIFFLPVDLSIFFEGAHLLNMLVFAMVSGFIIWAMEGLRRAHEHEKLAKVDQEKTAQRYRLALKAGRLGTWQWRVPSGEVNWSATLEEIHGVKPGSFGGTFDDFRKDIHPEDVDRVLAAIERSVNQGDEYQIQYRIRRPDGATRWLEVRGEVFKDEDGKPDIMTGFCADVTDRVTFEEQLTEQRAWLETTLTSIGDAVIATDANGAVSFMNKVAESLTGWPVDTARHQDIETVFRIINEDTRASTDNPVRKVLAHGSIVGLANHTVLIRRDGSEIPIDDSGAPILDQSGNVIGAVLVFRDITERRAAERLIEEAHKRVTNILESITDAFVSIDREWRYKYINGPAQRMLRKDESELLHIRIWDAFPDLQSSPFEKALRMAMDDREVSSAEAYYESLDIWIACKCYPSYEGISVFFQDVTDRRRSEEALFDERERFRITLSSIGDGVIATDTNLNVAFMNAVASSLTGWDTDEAIGRPLSEIFRITDENSGEAIENPAEEALQRGEIVALSNGALLHRRDGSILPIDDSGAPILSGKGEIVGSVLVFRDITDRQRAERALAEAEERARLVLQSATDYAFITTDMDGRITGWSPGAQKIFGYAEDEARDQDISIFFTHRDEEHQIPDVEMQKSLSQGRAHDERWHVRKDGSRFWASGLMMPLLTEGGEVKGFLKIVRDMTAHRRQEEALRESQDRLKQLNETLEERVQERTHTMIRYQRQLRSLASQLARTEQQERQRVAAYLHDNLAQTLLLSKMRLARVKNGAAVEDVSSAIQDLSEFLDSALDYTRGLMSDLSPPVIVHQNDLSVAIKWLAEQMEKHDLKVVVTDESKPKPLGKEVLAQVFQSVKELLFNVIKHAGVNEAEVAVSKVDNALQIEIVDHGDGFDANIFEQGPADDGGFGLFHIRERMDLLGGTFAIDTAPGDGTRVTLMVPLLEGEIEEKESVAIASDGVMTPSERPTDLRQKITVLLVDDHKMVREGLRKIVDEENDMVVIAEAADGETAIQLAGELRPDVIVMDINMPKLNGLEATRRILKDLTDIHVVGLSLHEDEDMANAMLEVGASAYLSKSQAFDMLCQQVRFVAGRKTRQ